MLTRASLSPTPTHPKVGKARGRIHVLSTWNPQPGRLTDGRGTPSWRPKFFCFPVGLNVWREGPRARASLRSLKSHNLGFPSSGFTGEGCHPAGGVARASEPQSGGRSAVCPPDSTRTRVRGAARPEVFVPGGAREGPRESAAPPPPAPNAGGAGGEDTPRCAVRSPSPPALPGVGGGREKVEKEVSGPRSGRANT